MAKQVDYKAMLEAINKIANSDEMYNLTEDTVNLHTGGYEEFTQEQAEKLASAMGQIYMISHSIRCTACQEKWLKK